jgi:parvulin-like peptidyl-prolyl isomerase
MIDIVNFKGVKATVRNTNFRFLTIAVLAFVILALTGCPGTSGTGGANEVAATVNGKAITMEEVERAVKQQAQGQESKLSPLELAAARLQVLEGLIQQEVMFQKAEKEATVPTDEEITAEYNKRRTSLGISAEQFDAKMKEIGETEASARLVIKKTLAIDKLVEKITGKIEPPKESEIADLFKGNPEMFVKKRGVRLAAIVIDPSDSGAGDTTKDENQANLKINEILGKIRQGNADFAALAREYSEDPSKLQNGEIGYLSEADLKKTFGDQNAAGFMNAGFTVGSITNPIGWMGKIYIVKLQERNEKDENMTLESPNVRQQINQMLVDNRKQLLSSSYAAIAMNEAKIENFLAKKVVENPNELSGARPAGMNTPPANTNTNSNVNTNTNVNTNANVPKNTNNLTKPAAKPSANK